MVKRNGQTRTNNDPLYTTQKTKIEKQ